MSNFKQKMERQLEEEKRAAKMREIHLLETEIKELENTGNTGNILFKGLKYFNYLFFLSKDKDAMFSTFVVTFVLLFMSLLIWGGTGSLFDKLGITLMILLIIILVIWSNRKKIDNYLNQSIYKFMQYSERQLELEKKDLEEWAKRQRKMEKN